VVTARGWLSGIVGLLLAGGCAELVGVEDTNVGDTQSGTSGGTSTEHSTGSSGEGGSAGNDGGIGGSPDDGASPEAGCPGVCMPLETRIVACYCGGSQTDTCSDTCQWVPGPCLMFMGTCAPGQMTVVDCGSCTKRIDTCSSSCQYTQGTCMSQCAADQVCSNNVCCFNAMHYCNTPDQCCSNNCVANLCP